MNDRVPADAVTAETIAALDETKIGLLRDWIAASGKVPGWIDGYGLGGSYVDPRAGGAGIGRRKAYVKLDHATARMVPELRGARWQAVADAIREHDLAAEAAAPRM